MASQQASRWDDVANDPSVTLRSGSIYGHGGIEYHHDGWSYQGSRFDVTTPRHRAARPLNEASHSSRAVQAASMRLQSQLNRATREPDSGYGLSSHAYNQDGQESLLYVGSHETLRQQYRDNTSPWGEHSLQSQDQSQDHVVQPHARTGFHGVSYTCDNIMAHQPPGFSHPGPIYHQDLYFGDWVEDHVYHNRDRLSQTLEELGYVRGVYSRVRLEHYRMYDEEYYEGHPRTRLHCGKGRYGDERRHQLHLPWDEY